MSSFVIIDGLRKPTNEESRYYFAGLTGGPPTEAGWSNQLHPIAKRYVALGVNPSQDRPIIFAVRPLFPKIVSLLESTDSPWTWFTCIRIGYGAGTRLDQDNLNTKHPAVLLLNVEYGTTFEQIARVTRTIKDLLDQHNVPIHVEVRENTLYNHGASSGLSEHQSLPTLESVVQDNNYWMAADVDGENALSMSQETLPLLSTLGWEVSKTKSKVSDDYGTAGPFFNFEGSDDLFVSTCFHVLLPETMNPKSIKPGKPGPEVSQTCPYNFNKILHFVDGSVKKYANSSAAMEAREKVGRYDEWLKSRSGPQPEEPHQSERTMADVYKYGSAILAALNTVYDDKVPGKNEVIEGTGIKKRVVGKVYAAPEYRVIGTKGAIAEPEARGFLNDWALVKLDKNKFRKPSNKVYLGRTGKSWLTAQVEGAPELTLEQQRAVDQEVSSQNGFLRMNGNFASIQEDDPKQGKCGIPCVRVLKRGASTHLTFGVTNSVEACVRATRFSGKKNVGASFSWEQLLLVVPFSDQAINVDTRTGTRRTCFSTAGDSGSAVLDMYGTFIGQVVSGGGPGGPPNTELETLRAHMDVTFVLMAGPLMVDIERWTQKEPNLLP
ncbi:hypothetical protein PG997_010366 [Apiospora hydei]|uniref:Uncharacterized protein n=1 Tax=Apiospora hydei TaxID=1337664 RepID=A0ABR1VWT0_9PEZI